MKSPFIIDSFKGKNNFIDATKIGPDEFTDLVNAHSKAGSLRADPASSENLTMPIPEIVFQQFTDAQLREYDPEATAILLTDTLTDTDAVLLKNHTPDVNNTGDTWHDAADTADIDGNQLKSLTGNNPKETYIDLSQSKYVATFDAYLWGARETENFTIYIRGNGVSPMTNYISFRFAVNASPGQPYVVYEDSDGYISTHSRPTDWSIGKWVTIKLTITATIIELKVDDDIIINDTNSKFASNDRFGFSFNSSISSATTGRIDNLNITYTTTAITTLTPDKHYISQFVTLTPIPAVNEIFGFFILMKANVSTSSYNIHGVVRRSNVGGEIDRTDLKHIYEVKTSDPQKVWRGFIAGLNQTFDGPNLSVGIYTEPGSDVQVYGHPSCSGWVQFDNEADTTPTPWNSVHAGQLQPMVVIVRSTTGIVDDMKAITLPYTTKKIAGTIGTDRVFSESSIIEPHILATVHNSSAPTYKNAIISSIGGVNQPVNGWTGQDAYITSKTILVKKDNVIAATAPDTQYCVPIMFQKPGLIDPDDTDTVINHDTLDAIVSNGNLILTGCGIDATSHVPNYVDLATNHGKALSVGPDAPEFIDLQGLALVFSKNYKFPFRMWYGVPGIINSFSPNFIENIFLGDPIITTAKFSNSLLYFSPTEIKRFSGVPGPGSVAPQIWTEGTKSKFGVVETKIGIFCLLDRQLYLYNGSMLPVKDLSDIIREKNDELRTEAFLIHLEKEEEILIQLDPSDSDCIIYNYAQQKFRTIDITSSFWRGSLPGLNRNILYVDGSNFKTLYGGSTYAAIIVQSGWISFAAELKNIKYLKFIIEASATSVDTLINIQFDFENISPIIYNNINLKHGTNEYVEVIEKLGVTARRFKYTITSSATIEQPKIHRIKVYPEIAKRS